jgi:ABC-type amino acid transport substrate-binding protein
MNGMKAVLVAALAALVALLACAPASAKFRITVAASDPTPAVGQRVAFVVTSERSVDYDLRLMAVAPGANVFRVVATITGDTGFPDPHVKRHGFEIELARIAPNRWRGTARFSRPGRWRVMVPNGAPVGVVIPNGVALLPLTVG